MMHLTEFSFATEILYSFIIIACSLMIYFGTRELYELSSHKGIKYFRLSFLYFAIASFFRSFVKFLLVTINQSKILDVSIRSSGKISFLFFVYFGSMSILYLLYSALYKKSKAGKDWTLVLHICAILLALLSFSIRNPIIHLVIQLLFFLGVVGAMLIVDRSKSHQNLYIIYLLLFFFWLLNMIDLILPNVFQGLQIMIYLASTSIFLLILYKVIKKTGIN